MCVFSGILSQKLAYFFWKDYVICFWLCAIAHLAHSYRYILCLIYIYIIWYRYRYISYDIDIWCISISYRYRSYIYMHATLIFKLTWIKKKWIRQTVVTQNDFENPQVKIFPSVNQEEKETTLKLTTWSALDIRKGRYFHLTNRKERVASRVYSFHSDRYSCVCLFNALIIINIF